MAGIDDAAREMLRGSSVALLATRSAKPRPFVTPIWFVVDDGALYFATGARSWAFRNVERNPEVSLLLGGERGANGARMLRIRGRATAMHGLPPARVLARVAAKYYLPPRAIAVELRHVAQWPLRMRYYASTPGGSGYLRVIPTSAEFLETA